MRYEEYELFEKGDRVKIEGTEYCGQDGVVAEDQIEHDFQVKVKLNNNEIVYIWSEYLVLK